MSGWLAFEGLSGEWIVQTLIASALLMGLVLALRGIVRRHFGARLAYALWLLPALRMMLPPLPGWRMLAVPVLVVEPHEATLGLVDPVDAVRLAGPPVGPPLHDVPGAILRVDTATLPAGFPHASLAAVPVDWAQLALAIWLGGAFLLFAWQMLRYRRFLGRALAGSHRLARDCGIDVLVSDHVSGPVAAGILRRRILLPADFLARYSSEERRLALKHEAAHHDRLDIVANLVALAITALHWWNPLAILAYRAFRNDQELACDATVLAEAAPGEQHIYGSALLKSASARMPAMACALSHKDHLKQRIGMMAKSRIGIARLACGAVLTTAAVAGGLLLTASGRAQAVEAPLPKPAVAPAPPAVAPPAPRAPALDAAWRQAEREHVATRRHLVEARRAAQAAQREANLAARAADIAARAATLEARRFGPSAGAMTAMVPSPHIPDVARLVHASLDRTRAELAARCAAQGVAMAKEADFGTLATCGNQYREAVRTALLTARASVAQDRRLGDEERAHALEGIDRAIARQDRRD
jgi:bla regulator protein BlaR1